MRPTSVVNMERSFLSFRSSSSSSLKSFYSRNTGLLGAYFSSYPSSSTHASTAATTATSFTVSDSSVSNTVVYGGGSSSSGNPSSSHSSSTSSPKRRITLNTLQNKRRNSIPISVLTAYDTCMAQAMDDVVDIILVGDSVGMVVLGQNSTIPVTLDTMIHHSQAVSRGSQRSYLVADLPFGSYGTVDKAISSATRLIQEGNMHSVKLEGGKSQTKKIQAIINEGIPVMGHIGLLPQTALLSTGYNLKGKTSNHALVCIEDALSISELGTFGMVMEMIPAQLALFISNIVPRNVFTIGIGAGPYCHGQVLVSYDMLGMYNNQHVPKFVKMYEKLYQPMHLAFSNYATDVHHGNFPSDGGATNKLVATSSSRSTGTRKYYQDMPLTDLEELQKAVHKLFPNEKEALRKLDTAVEDLQIQTTGHKVSFQPSSVLVQKDGSLGNRVNKAIEQSTVTIPHNLRIGIVGSGAIASLLAASLSYLPNHSTVTMFSSWDQRLNEIKEKGIGWRSNITGKDGISILSPIQYSTIHSTVSLNDSATKGWIKLLQPTALGKVVRSAENRNVTAQGLGNLEGHIGMYDAVFLCGKAHQIREQATLASLLVKSGTEKGTVIPLYNGAYTLEYLQRLFGEGYKNLDHKVSTNLSNHLQSLHPHQILYGQTAMGSRMVGIKEETGTTMIVEHTGYGPLHICIPPIFTAVGIKTESIEQINAYRNVVEYLSQAGPGNGSGHWLLQVKSSQEFYSVPYTESLRWTKIAMNSVLNPIVALFGVRNGGFNTVYETNSKFRNLIEQLCAESASALEHRSLGKVRWSGNDLLMKVREIAVNTANNSNSMLVDLSQGNITEIDFINGAILDTLKHLNVKESAHENVMNAVYARQNLVGKDTGSDQTFRIIKEFITRTEK